MNTNENQTQVSIHPADKTSDSDTAFSPQTEVNDPFDIARFRISQDFVAQAGVKKLLTTVPTRKPSKEWFITTHPDEEYRLSTFVLELKEDSETYLVDPSLWPDLATESTFSPRALIATMNRQRVVFLWPIRLPGSDGKIDDWNKSSMEAANLAMGRWIRVQSNRSLGAYEVCEATGTLGEITWDVPSFQEILKVAFKDRFIETIDHPVLRRLRGEA